MIKLWYFSQLETNDSTKTLSNPFNLNSENKAELTVLNVNLKGKTSYIHQASSDLSNVKIVFTILQFGCQPPMEESYLWAI